MNEQKPEQAVAVVPEAESPEIETTDTGLVTVESKRSVDDILFLAENIDKVIQAHNKIRVTLLKLAQKGDWCLFKKDDDPNDDGKAELGAAGAERIGSALGVNFSNWKSQRLTGTDEYGDWFRGQLADESISWNPESYFTPTSMTRAQMRHIALSVLKDIEGFGDE